MTSVSLPVLGRRRDVAEGGRTNTRETDGMTGRERERVLAIIRRHVDAFNRRDVEALAADFRDDIIFTTGKDVVRGAAELRIFFGKALDGRVELQLEIRRVVIEGDVAACEMTETISVEDHTHQAPIAAFYTVRGNRLAELRVYREGSADLQDL